VKATAPRNISFGHKLASRGIAPLIRNLTARWGGCGQRHSRLPWERTHTRTYLPWKRSHTRAYLTWERGHIRAYLPWERGYARAYLPWETAALPIG
jgi:hypothetical protein